MAVVTAFDTSSKRHVASSSQAMLYTVLALLLAVALVLLSPGGAHAAAIAHDSSSAARGLLVSDRADGSLEVSIDGESYTVHMEAAANRAIVTLPDGSVTAVDLGGFVTAQSHGALQATFDNTTAAPASAGGFTCNFLMWVVGLVHGGAWAAVIAVVIATGPAGVAVASIMYALGASGFLYWVGTQCPS